MIIEPGLWRTRGGSVVRVTRLDEPYSGWRIWIGDDGLFWREDGRYSQPDGARPHSLDIVKCVSVFG